MVAVVAGGVPAVRQCRFFPQSEGEQGRHEEKICGQGQEYGASAEPSEADVTVQKPLLSTRLVMTRARPVVFKVSRTADSTHWVSS